MSKLPSLDPLLAKAYQSLIHQNGFSPSIFEQVEKLLFGNEVKSQGKKKLKGIPEFWKLLASQISEELQASVCIDWIFGLYIRSASVKVDLVDNVLGSLLQALMPNFSFALTQQLSERLFQLPKVPTANLRTAENLGL